MVDDVALVRKWKRGASTKGKETDSVELSSGGKRKADVLQDIGLFMEEFITGESKRQALLSVDGLVIKSAEAGPKPMLNY